MESNFFCKVQLRERVFQMVSCFINLSVTAVEPLLIFGLVRSNKRGVPFEYGSLFLGGTGRFVFFLRMEGGEWGKVGDTLPSQPSHLSHTFDSYLSFHVIKHCKSMIDKCLYCSVSFQLPTLTLVLPFHGSCTLSTPYSLGLLPLL